MLYRRILTEVFLIGLGSSLLILLAASAGLPGDKNPADVSAASAVTQSSGSTAASR